MQEDTSHVSSTVKATGVARPDVSVVLLIASEPA